MFVNFIKTRIINIIKISQKNYFAMLKNLANRKAKNKAHFLIYTPIRDSTE